MSAEKLSGGENVHRRKRPSEKTSVGENIQRRKCPGIPAIGVFLSVCSTKSGPNDRCLKSVEGVVPNEQAMSTVALTLADTKRASQQRFLVRLTKCEHSYQQLKPLIACELLKHIFLHRTATAVVMSCLDLRISRCFIYNTGWLRYYVSVGFQRVVIHWASLQSKVALDNEFMRSRTSKKSVEYHKHRENGSLFMVRLYISTCESLDGLQLLQAIA
uniref:F-box domain-containing protein n=1 Tax=Steinernema glaseri TaxID=37863 RepID=A0A1I8ARG3_9BILA